MAKSTPMADALRKLDRPPGGPNWVRFIEDSPEATCRRIVRFVLGMPTVNYQAGYKAIRDSIELKISREAAVRLATSSGSPEGRLPNKELVEAFCNYNEVRSFAAANPVGFEGGLFRISREIHVPVAPLSVIRENGAFTPIFLCGWSSNPLNTIQRRLLMTLYEDAFLSLTDYQGSPAEVLFFPKPEKKAERATEKWARGDYDLLSAQKLRECVEIFMQGRELARGVLLELASQQVSVPSEAETEVPSRQISLPF